MFDFKILTLEIQGYKINGIMYAYKLFYVLAQYLLNKVDTIPKYPITIFNFTQPIIHLYKDIIIR